MALSEEITAVGDKLGATLDGLEKQFADFQAEQEAAFNAKVDELQKLEAEAREKAEADTHAVIEKYDAILAEQQRKEQEEQQAQLDAVEPEKANNGRGIGVTDDRS